MLNIKNFCSRYCNAIAWTVFYAIGVSVLLHWLFNFNVFSETYWARLLHTELHGFPGLVFGAMFLAVVPLYIAVMVLILRDKSVPIKLPVPHCFLPVPEKPVSVPAQPIVTEQETLPELHPGIPAEMRESFMRARKNYGVRQMSVFNKPMTIKSVGTAHAAVPAVADVADVDGAFPVPNDFDIDSGADTDYGVPVFSEVNFDDASDADENNSEQKSPVDDLCEFLIGAGHDAHKTDNDLIISGNFAIGYHNDDDFWVADEFDWFAAGRQKPSPIAALINAATENNMRAILCLEQNNIMDYDTISADWIAQGITIVTNRQDLLKILNATE